MACSNAGVKANELRDNRLMTRDAICVDGAHAAPPFAA
jgi:hypothetical protein